MPYILPEKRIKYDNILIEFDAIDFEGKGDLEYCIFKLMKMYMRKREERYSTLHDTVYAAQHCADEFRRRFLDKREDQAMLENEDVHALFSKKTIEIMDFTKEIKEEIKEEDITRDLI